jgi:hypothetical protein
MPNSLLLFDVLGPFRVPMNTGKGGRCIPKGCPEFWEGQTSLAAQKGCYVFAIQAGKGFRPIYVGKTKRSFERECFADHKIASHYQPAIVNTGKGTPVVFFLVPRARRGKLNQRVLGDLETFLIQVASAKNPELSNIQKRTEARWGIPGVIRGGKGKPAQAARKLRSAVGL